MGVENPTSVTSLVALLVCLASSLNHGALLSAIGIAGMSRLNEAKCVGDERPPLKRPVMWDTLLLDKTGTITLGNRQANGIHPGGWSYGAGAGGCAQLASLPDETPEGRSVVILAKEKFGIRGRNLSEAPMEFYPFTAKTRNERRKYERFRKSARWRGRFHEGICGGAWRDLQWECGDVVKRIASQGGTPLVVSKDHIILGVIYLEGYH